MSKRDHTLIIDRSGSMAIKDQPGGPQPVGDRPRERARAGRQVRGARSRRHHAVRVRPRSSAATTTSPPSALGQVFIENEPAGGIDPAGVLAHAFGSYFDRKRAGTTQEEGETIVVVTDGEPDDQKAVMKTILDATKRLDRDEELGVSLVQVGRDPLATRFLKALDDDLVQVGARFDICDTITLDEMEDLSLSEVLLRAIHD